MYRSLLCFLFNLILIGSAFSQSCPGDVSILEDENIQVWKVAVDGTQVFSLGTFQGTVNVGDTVLTQPVGYGVYVAAYDISGSFMWVQQITGNEFFATNPTLIVNSTDVVVAVTELETGYANHILRVEAFGKSSGTPGWSNSYTTLVTTSNLPFGAQIMPYDGETDDSGNLYISGAFSGSIDLGGTVLNTTAGLSESFVLACSSSGTELWAVQSTGSNGRGRVWSLATDAFNDVIIGGHFTGTVAFGASSFTASDANIINPYIAKLSSSDGSALWVAGLDNGSSNGFNNIYSVTTDTARNVYYTGNFNDNITIQGNTVNAIGGTEMLIGSLDPNGTHLWANQLGGVSSSDEFGTTINYSMNYNTILVSGQIVTDSVYYNNTYQAMPGIFGPMVLTLSINGTIDANPASAFSVGETFGYSSAYLNDGDYFVFGSTSTNDGKNIDITQWAPNRPKPIVHLEMEDGMLNPSETLTAYDPGLYSYQWFRNGVSMPGETSTVLSPIVNGQYHYEALNSFGCSTTSKKVMVLDGISLESDSLVLVELYNNTNGANWNNNTNWLSGNINTWDGVTINGGRVTELYLANNNMNGEFPQSIGSLTALQQLYFDTNNLTGSIPSTIWNLTNLIQLNVHDNPNLNWQLDANIQNMTALSSIRAFNSNLTGTIPAEIGNVSSLTEFWVSGCNLTGTIPSSIGSLSALNTFRIDGNQISGSIPTAFWSLPALANLDISGNPINDVIPADISNLASLVEFRANNAGLTGTIPDALWRLPNIQYITLGDNQELNVPLPTGLDTLIQLREISIPNTQPLATAFPGEIYSLTNLESLDLGGHQLTGTLDAQIGNLTNLRGLWLWSNQLEGAFPTEILSTQLEGMSISGNRFTSIPDFTTMPSMVQLEVEFNLLDFDDISANIGIANFRYNPQGTRPHAYTTVDPGGALDLINVYDAPGNQYQWVLNITDSIATTMNYQITGATFDDLGAYYCKITNPAVPDLTIQTEFFNVAFSGAPKSFTVDNSPNSMADFKSFYAATYGTNDGDTLYVAGSSIPYNRGFALFESPRIIYGPGYFISENPETQATSETAQVYGMGFKKGAEGSEVYGLDIFQVLLNNQSSKLNDTLRNVHFTGNKINMFGINDDCQNILVNKNYITNFTFASTPLNGVSRSYQDIFIQNNIIDTVTTVFAKATAAKNVMTNVIFDFNTINIFTDSIQDATVTNNIINDYQATGNSASGNIDYATAAFANNSGLLNIDNDFVPTNTVSAGAFSGTDPYVLSGIPPIPHIFELTNTGRIRINAMAKALDGEVISKLNYRLGQNGTVIDKGTVKRLETGNPVDVLFRPRLGNVTPGGTYDLMIWARNATGQKSVHHTISFVAETTNASGNIFTSDNQPVTNGEVLLFEINQEGTAFDTLATTLNNQGAFAFSNIVIGDYLALGKADTTAYPGQLPTYYERIDLWEEADTLFIDATNPTFDIRLIAEPKSTTGSGVINGTLEEEEQAESSDGRMMARKRVGQAGVSARRAVRTARTSEVVYELVAFTYTNVNGEFQFKNLPDDTYRINIQYPGYPMDTLTDVDITIAENQHSNYNVEALVKDGKIAVTLVTTTGLMDEIIQSINVYPNPTTAEGITVEFTKNVELKGRVELQLFSTTGNLALTKSLDAAVLRSERKVYLPLEGFNRGTYILRLSQDKKELGTVRLIVH
ncbi:hypothetical protein C900_05402 [Fulvivirga imtechensis AK7]|uniref:Secretion system C-terminal sorting domain-containing protein n=1 Tax=Fulvivirga imtechensis AK7 TaxID=1237149 RepID=L8JP11_9BACT|nr:T9SS type A sorting domain-containing protein [Fulvivirga imtechensis]ELR69122.1 hypothetical protein C900_05402 [Fulvivirga imtechensis AK7]